MSIKLYTEPSSTLHQDFADSQMNLQSDVLFQRAVVTAGTWIFYTDPNYNNDIYGGSQSNYMILKPGDDKNITGVNGSMYLVPDQTEGIILFEHAYYGGYRKWFEESCPNVNSLFPSGAVGGVSSVIVLSKNQSFEIFTKINYEGQSSPLEPGMWYDTPHAMRFPNDKLQSFRKI